MTDIEITDLEELIGGKGWAWLMGQYDKFYGPNAIVDLLRKVSREDIDPQKKTEVIARAVTLQEAIETFLKLPKKEIQDRRAAIKPPDEFAGQRRT